MKAKFIYEKFTEDSDPIDNMNIGYAKFRILKPGDILYSIKEIKKRQYDRHYDNRYFLNYYWLISEIAFRDDHVYLAILPFSNYCTNFDEARSQILNNHMSRYWTIYNSEFTYKELRDHFKPISYDKFIQKFKKHMI